ncbi:putative exosortase protein [Verrucomicrobiia bacterium DG1235]|nr:putative exosortase protein [Verrucomicrobiae bacterium DG1235]
MKHPRSEAPEASSKDPENEKKQIVPPLRLSYTLIGAILLLSAVFGKQLLHLWELAMSSDLYSHTLLIPVVSLYLVWENRGQTKASSPLRSLAIVPALVGAALLTLFIQRELDPSGGDEREAYLFFAMGAYVSFLIGAIVALAGRDAVRTNIFPIFLLLFLVPFHPEVKIAIQTFFQHASADAAYWLIKTSGVPIFRTGLIFEMPTIDMEVAPQCSGIRSTLVLFITSLVGSYLFLKKPWKRAVIVFLVIPLGIARNGIRILILAQLCYQYGPEQIHGWFHNRGGQPLFVVTLIPLFALLYLFWRSERSSNKDQSQA